MLENVSLSFRGIWSHKTRSLLTMLGIIIGIASIITIVSTIKGTNEQIKQNLIGSGTNVVTVSLQASGDGYYEPGYSARPDGIKDISEETIEGLKALDHVSGVSAYVTRSYAENTNYRAQSFEGAIYGIDEAYLDVNSYKLNIGRTFTEGDFSNRRKVVIVDSKVMENLFGGEDPVNKTLEIMGEPFTVVGVVSKSENKSVVINSVSDYQTYADTSSGEIFIPIDSWSTIYMYDEIRYAAIKADSTDNMTEAGSAAADYLNEELVSNSSYKYKANDLLEQASELQTLANSTNQQLIWIAGISLLVGGIGVMNIMLVSVTERTREIGLKKAIGAKRRRILAQFLTEAATLTSIGGLIGVIAGIVLAKLISGASGTPSAVSIPACVIAVAFSMCIGIIFGIIPAVKASRLNPIEALRRD